MTKQDSYLVMLARALTCYFFDFCKNEVKALVIPELAFVRGKLAHDISCCISFVASNAYTEAMEVHFATKCRDDAFDTIVSVSRASQANVHGFDLVRKRV